MKKHDALAVVNTLMNSARNGTIEKNDRCCGESGTLAITRPDISTQVRFRKEEELRAGVAGIRDGGHRGEVKILTSCPSCLQGLKRYNDDTETDADYIVVEIAKNLLGADWLPRYVQLAKSGGIERVGGWAGTVHPSPASFHLFGLRHLRHRHERLDAELGINLAGIVEHPILHD